MNDFGIFQNKFLHFRRIKQIKATDEQVPLMVNFQNMVFQRNVQQILIGKTQNPGKIRQTVKYFLFHPVFSPGFQINQANAGIIILFQSDGRHETVITAAVRRSIDGARRVITVNVRVVQIPQRGNGDQITVQTQYLVQFRLKRGNPQTKIRFLTDMGVGISGIGGMSPADSEIYSI